MHADSLTPMPQGHAQPSLEELLALRPDAPPADEPAAPAASPAEPAGPPKLLLALTTPASGASLLPWAQALLDGQAPPVAHGDEAIAAVQQLQPQAVLIEFAPDQLDAASTLAARLQAGCPEVARVAVGRAQHPQCLLAALRAGVQDFLDADGEVGASRRTLDELLDRRQHAVAMQPELRHAPATQLAIISARSGLGCSVLAAHVAWYLQQALLKEPHGHGDTQALTCLLVELGGSSGDCAIYLNTPGEFTLVDAVAQQRRLDQRMAQAAIARHDSGLRLLPQAPDMPAPPPGGAQALMSQLRQFFRHIVLDLGANTPVPLLGEMLADAHEIWVVCDQNVVSVVRTMALLGQVEALGIPRERMRLIVNRHDPRLALDAHQLASRLQLPLLATLPERRRELADAINHGKLLGPGHRGDPYVLAVEQLVATQLPTTEPPQRHARAAGLGRLLPGLRRR